MSFEDPGRVYVYIDGESHFLRSKEAWTIRKNLPFDKGNIAPIPREGYAAHEVDLEIDHGAKIFWDSKLMHTVINAEFTLPIPAVRQIYFTSMAGDASAIHQAKCALRRLGLEPYVIQERRQLSDQRATLLDKTNVIEKAKGVDIALAVRLMEDATRNNFDTCCLFTSDVDYLPLVEAVRRMGKQVCVAGFKAGLGKESPYEYVPDRFIDMADFMLARLYEIRRA